MFLSSCYHPTVESFFDLSFVVVVDKRELGLASFVDKTPSKLPLLARDVGVVGVGIGVGGGLSRPFCIKPFSLKSSMAYLKLEMVKENFVTR